MLLLLTLTHPLAGSLVQSATTKSTLFCVSQFVPQPETPQSEPELHVTPPVK